MTLIVYRIPNGIVVVVGWIIYEKNNDKNATGYPGMYIEYSSEDGNVEQKALYVCGVDWKDDSGHREQIEVRLDRDSATKNICMDVSQSVYIKFNSYKPDTVLMLEVEENEIENFNEKELAKAKEINFLVKSYIFLFLALKVNGSFVDPEKFLVIPR